MTRILIVDDEPYMLELMQTIIRENTTYETKTLSDPYSVMPSLNREHFDLALLDLRMPGHNGMEILREIRTHHPQTDVIIVTAYGTIPSAVEAVNKGAFDYITKPFNKNELILAIERVVEWQAIQKENVRLKEALVEKFDFDRLVGASQKIREIYDHARRLADTDTLIYLEGEIGTGKSALAKAIHYHGPRKGAPIIEIACGTIPEGQLNVTLFGRKGNDPAEGLIRKARGGTLHVSDIQYLSEEIQNKLIRIIESRTYFQEGSQELESTDVRLLFSSDRGLKELSDQGLVCQRFSVILEKFRIFLPPLRARREDIPLFVEKFVEAYGSKYGKRIGHISDEAMKWFLSMDWPGNIRELENTVERAVILTDGDLLEIKDIYPPDYLNSFIFSADPAVFDLPFGEALEKSIDRFGFVFEQQYIGHCLARFKGDIEKSASHMGVTPEAFKRKINRLNLSQEAYKRGIL